MLSITYLLSSDFTRNDERFFHTSMQDDPGDPGGINLHPITFMVKASNISGGYPCNLITFTHAFQGGHMREDAHKRRKKAQSNILVSSNPSQSRVEMMRA